MTHRHDLQATEHVGGLIQRWIGTVEGAADFALRIRPLVPNFVDEHVDALLGSELAKMEKQRKLNADATVHAPKEHSDLFLRSPGEAKIPEEHLPIEGPALRPEGGAETTTIRHVAGLHKALEVMAGDQFVLDRRSRKEAVVP